MIRLHGSSMACLMSELVEVKNRVYLKMCDRLATLRLCVGGGKMQIGKPSLICLPDCDNVETFRVKRYCYIYL